MSPLRRCALLSVLWLICRLHTQRHLCIFVYFPFCSDGKQHKCDFILQPFSFFKSSPIIIFFLGWSHSECHKSHKSFTPFRYKKSINKNPEVAILKIFRHFFFRPKMTEHQRLNNSLSAVRRLSFS